MEEDSVLNFRWFYVGVLVGSMCSSGLRKVAAQHQHMWAACLCSLVLSTACVCAHAEVSQNSISVGPLHILAMDQMIDDEIIATLEAPSENPTRNIDHLELEALSYGEEEQKTCSVCLEDFMPGDIVNRLKCGHVFHPQCIYTWATYKATCPTCRAVFDE